MNFIGALAPTRTEIYESEARYVIHYTTRADI